MKSINLHNYDFNKLCFSKFHHTDATGGAPANYIALMLKGSAEIASDEYTIKAKEGDVFFIPKNLSYHSYWYGNPDVIFLSIGYQELYTSNNSSYKLQLIPCDETVKEAIKAIEPTGTDVTCRSLSNFYNAMALLLPLMKASNGKEKQITELAKALIRRNPRISIAEIADICSVSEPYLYILFKRVEKTTPNAYRHITLCQTAYTLLTTTDKSIEEISDELWFSSSAYFRKTIKDYFGISPRDIRKTRGI